VSQPRFERFLSLIKRFSGFALPVRLLASAAVTLAAGTGLGFVAEYAAYSWAIYYGIRPPLEGIPYLRVAVTGLTVAVLFGGAVVYIAAQLAAHLLLDWLTKNVEKARDFGRSIEKLAPKTGAAGLIEAGLRWYRDRKVLGALVISGALAAAALLYVYYVDNLNASRPRELTPLVAVPLLVFVSMLLIWNTNTKYWISITAVLLVVLGGPVAFFHVEVYGNLLRALGYGGGSRVSVTVVEDPQSNAPRTVVSGYLMLRTTTALIVFESTTQRMREVPMQQVLFIDHSVTTLSDRPYRLPW